MSAYGTDDAGNRLALQVLKPLARYYEMGDIEEVAINRPGEVWIKPRRADWQARPAPEITYEYIARHVCRVLANITNATYNEFTSPIVSCELPGLPFRFQAVVGHNVRYHLTDRFGMVVAIRALGADDSIDLAAYGLIRGGALKRAERNFEGFDIGGDYIALIQQAIERHLSIVVSGATSTGKTTFLNQIVKMIDLKKRVITVEDAREVTIPHPNRSHLIVPRNRSRSSVGYKEVINALMRLTPDFIICGEISVENSLPVYSLMGKGHPVFTTIHAGSPEEAKRAFINNMAADAVNLDLNSALDVLNAQTGCIIQLERVNNRRQVVAVEFPATEYEKKIRAEQMKRDAEMAAILRGIPPGGAGSGS